MQNDLLLRALACNNHSRPPVWLMRQAGRYMASYRKLREKYSFLQMCHEPDLIAEVTSLPIKTFNFDAAILFSDILVIPEAMGLGLQFQDHVGPIIDRPLQSEQDLKLIENVDVGRLNFVEKGIQLLKKELSVPLIGFCGAPFTVASYMIEGKSSPDLKKTKKWMLTDPESFHQVLKVIADWSIAYLNMQIDAGIDAIQIFDSWANTLTHSHFLAFSLPYLNYIMKSLKKSIPVILFCRGSSVFGEELATISPAAISFDWNCNLALMRKKIPYPVAFQGNLDPHVLYSSENVVKKEVKNLLKMMSGDKGFIFNLGHGILPDIPEDSVKCLVDCIKGHSYAS